MNQNNSVKELLIFEKSVDSSIFFIFEYIKITCLRKIKGTKPIRKKAIVLYLTIILLIKWLYR
ncbi:hypothetical protein EVI01_26170 [Enterococcus villorum]|uniref:Uncharacterized protein n=1 Tax=Enterococcus villorum TaxID=112904 RepID=A0A511J5J6_9ENTE|nr:hypothetical protein EVI01_26170 [Enterococcus villorum]